MYRIVGKGKTARGGRQVSGELLWEKDRSFVFSAEWNEKVRRLRAENDIVTRLLVNDSKKEREHAKFYASRTFTDTRILPKAHAVDRFVVYVLGETVSILSLEQNNLVGIKITNRHIAANFEQMFDGLWDASKKAPSR